MNYVIISYDISFQLCVHGNREMSKMPGKIAKILLISVLNHIFLSTAHLCVLPLLQEDNTWAICWSTSSSLLRAMHSQANNINEQLLLSSKPLQSHKSKFSHFDRNLWRARERERAAPNWNQNRIFSEFSIWLNMFNGRTTHSNKIYIFLLSVEMRVEFYLASVFSPIK